MHIPTQAQWQTVIDKFYSILPFTLEHEDHLDMLEPVVLGYGHECGTVHCVAGWYAIASMGEDVFNLRGTDYISYSTGVAKMANDLGFEHLFELPEWAHKNKKLWGNPYGSNLFTCANAYTNKYKSFAGGISDIIHHLELVKYNCLKAESI